MGLPLLTRGQAIAALSEAIDVVRVVWNVEIHGGVQLEGIYHATDGVLPGPAPAHDMSISLGAYKPQMLRLVGQKTDGWAARLGDLLTHAQWKSASELIDEAAIEAGRDPREIRRMAGITGDFDGRVGHYLQGPPGQWIEQLLPSVIEDGVGTFIVATDNRSTMQRFAEEVIPALRAAVAAERSKPPQTLVR